MGKGRRNDRSRLPPDIFSKKRRQGGEGSVSPLQQVRGIAGRFGPTPSRGSGLTEEAKSEHAGQGAKARMVATSQLHLEARDT